MKVFTIVFAQTPSDNALLNASVKALASDVLAARYGHTVEHDDSTGKTTLKWWRIPTGGWNESEKH